MRVRVRVCTDQGWSTWEAQAPAGSDLECYALPRDVCRAKFWSQKLGLVIPAGRALIWQKVED